MSLEDVFQYHENDRALLCVVQEPTTHANLFGNLQPCGELYEKPFDLERARAQHRDFVSAMEQYGVHVVRVSDILAENCHQGKDFDMKKRIRLEALAMGKLKYRLVESVDPKKLTDEEAYYISDQYKQKCIERMHTEQLVQILLTCPIVTLNRSYRDTPMVAVNYTMNPLGNLIFTRDQQITTRHGIVMSNMASAQRSGEVDLMVEVMANLAIPVIGRIVNPGKLEGGDFFMAGDTCFIGSGFRTNSIAIAQLMEKDLLGTEYVVEVRDLFERTQNAIHLDCVFNIVADDVVLLLDTLIDVRSPTRRLVREYRRDARTGRYVLARNDVHFATYLEQRGFHIIGIPVEFQLQYGVNCLNLGDSRIVMMHHESARLVARHPHFKGKVNVVDFAEVTSMYGSLHCTTQIVRRRYLPESQRVSTCAQSNGVLVEPPPGARQSAPAASTPTNGAGPSAQDAVFQFVCQDVASVFRNGVPQELLEAIDQRGDAGRLDKLRAQSIQSFVIREASQLNQALVDQHVPVRLVCREDNYFASNSNRVSPSGFLFVHDRAVWISAATSALQELDIRASLDGTTSKAVAVGRCPVASLHGGLDLVIHGTICFVAKSTDSLDEAASSWLNDKLHLTVVFVTRSPTAKQYDLSRLLLITDRFVVICSECLAEDSVAKVRSLLPQHAWIEVSEAQARRFCTSLVTIASGQHDRCVVVSRQVWSTLREDQQKAIESSSDQLIRVDLDFTETIGLGSVRELMVPIG